MNRLLKIEELGLFLLAILLYSPLECPWWVFLALLLTPDLGMLGYVFGPKAGAATYNFTHHKGLGVALYGAGVLGTYQAIALIGLIILAHSSLDRVLGYGLKYPDSFHHTHLGWIGRRREVHG